MRVRSSLLLCLVTSAACFEDGNTVGGDEDGGAADTASVASGESDDGVDDPGMTGMADDDGDPGDDGTVGNAPPTVTVVASAESLSQDQSITFDVTASDPDGATTLVGGTLMSGDQTLEFGPLVALTAEQYTFTLTWDELHARMPVDFDTEMITTFRVEVADDTGATGFAGVEVVLTCGGMSACDGQCVDKSTSNDHCGTCGRQCITHDHELALLVGSCNEGACLPTFSECWTPGDFSNCADYCASIDQTCAQGGGTDLPLTGCAGYTLRYYEAAAQHACVDVPDFGWATFSACTAEIDLPPEDSVRCCCTQ